MKPDRFQQFIAAARRGRPQERPLPLPPFLAIRVAASWAATPRSPHLARLWERLCWWGAGTAVAICLATGVLQSSRPEPTGFDLLLELPQAGDISF